MFYVCTCIFNFFIYVYGQLSPIKDLNIYNVFLLIQTKKISFLCFQTSNVYGQTSHGFTPQTVYNMFQKPEDLDNTKLSTIPPTNPAGDTYYIYKFDDCNERKDWFADGYTFKNMGNVIYYPKQTKELKRSRYCIKDHSTSGYNPNFTRTVFEMTSLQSPCYVLVQYLGDQSLYIPRSHGNAKNTDKPYRATAASVRAVAKEKVRHDTARTTYIKESMRTDVPQEYQGRCNARNETQMRNIRQSWLNSQKLGPDPLNNLHQIAKELPGYIRKLDTLESFICILAMDDIVNMVDVMLENEVLVFGYDTTFELGDFYCSVLLVRHPYIKGRPAVPVAFLLHETKMQTMHSRFMRKMCKLIPRLATASIVIIMDRERSLTNAVKEYLKNANIIYCWNHLLRDITQWSAKHNEKGRDYKNDIKHLLHCSHVKDYHHSVDAKVRNWSLAFSRYYAKHVEKDVLDNCGRWVIDHLGLYDTYSGITSNLSESYNNVIKGFLSRKEVTQDIMALKAYELQSYCIVEIKRWIAGCGNYVAVSGMEEKLKTCINPQTDVTNIEDIKTRVRAANVKNVKHGFQAPPMRKLVAHELTDHRSYVTSSPLEIPRKPSVQYTLAQLACEQESVEYVKRWDTYFVKGMKQYYCVKLVPREACTCDSPKPCYHIAAAQMTAGTYDQHSDSVSTVTITEMMKRKRQQPQKKSGRKKPRTGDMDDFDMVSDFEMSQNSNNSLSQNSVQSMTSINRRRISMPKEPRKKRHLLSLKRPIKDGSSSSKAISINNTLSSTPAKTSEQVVVDRQREIRDPDVQSGPWVEELNLDKAEEKIIKDEEGLLTDRSVEAASILLKRQFPAISGLCSSVMAPFKLDEPDEAGNPVYDWKENPVDVDIGRPDKATGIHHVQIFSNLDGHWVCSAKGFHGDDTIVCDSLSNSSGGKLNTGLEVQLSHVYGSPRSNLYVTVPRTDQQPNGFDCGVYAIAFATSLCFASLKKDHTQYHMEQYIHSEMRPHLFKCFNKRLMTRFPVTGHVIPKQIVSVRNIGLGCTTCNLPSHYCPLVRCDMCRAEVHQKCAKKLLVQDTETSDVNNGTQSSYCRQCFSVLQV